MLDQPTTRDFLAEDLSPAARSTRRLIMAAVLLAIFMVATDSYIVATAMPTIVSDLGGCRLFSWAFAAFLLAQTVTIPINGRLADLYGRKPVFFAGTSLFLLGSLLCGFAWGMVPLILFRALEGVGAGAIQPIATTIVGDIYTPVERARMQGYVSGMFGIAAVIGPTLGAFVIEHVSWSLVFWVNIPVGIATFVMFGLYLHEKREPRRHRIDYLGSGLLMAGVGAPMLALVQIGNADAATLTALAIGGIVALAALAANERRAAEPMLPFRLWRNRVVAIGCLAGFFNGALMMTVSGFLPTYVQGAMGGDATASGVVLAASSVAWAFASMAAGRLMIRTSYRLTASIGGLTLIAGSIMLIELTPASGLLWAGTGALLLGAGMGFCNTAFIVSIQASVDWADRGMATSSAMFMRIVGQSIGAAVFGAILNFGVYSRLPEAGDAVNRLLSPTARQGLGATEIARLTEAIGISLHLVYVIAGLVAAVSLILALALPARLSPTRPHRSAT
ncbi:MAG TPA: MDR family MFS transporter [Stellaceae bacterium]|nr:MDR family MFS transporter [Stellaceae bacterium]